MAYRLYMDGILYPVTPSKITMKINGKNETVTLINEGEANILKSPGLTDVDFELLLPAVQYPFAVYPNGFRPAKYYLDKLEALMSAKSAFQYLVICRNRHNVTAVTFHAKNESIEHFFSICILEPNRITISNVDSSVHKAEFEHSGADLPLRRNLHLFFHRRHIRRAIMLYQ